MTTQLPHLFNTALSAILEASAETMKIYNQNQVEVSYKSDESPVTQADLKSSSIIIEYLEKTGIPIICEETKIEDYGIRNQWDYLWLVDPLDGTKEFISRNGEFTVNIALIEKRRPILGLITIPAIGLLYWGDNMNGAYKATIAQIIQMDYQSLIHEATKLPIASESGVINIVASRSHLDPETKQTINQLESKYPNVKCVNAGSSLKFCYIAEGKANLYFRFSTTMEWDTAAGQAIIEASGAKMTELPSGNPFVYNKEDLRNNGFCVTSESLAGFVF